MKFFDLERLARHVAVVLADDSVYRHSAVFEYAESRIAGGRGQKSHLWMCCFSVLCLSYFLLSDFHFQATYYSMGTVVAVYN